MKFETIKVHGLYLFEGARATVLSKESHDNTVLVRTTRYNIPRVAWVPAAELHPEVPS